MLFILIVTAIQVLYWFSGITALLTESLVGSSLLENRLLFWLLQPLTAFVSSAPKIYVLLQCILFSAIFICALLILFLKKFSLKTKICACINIFCVIAVFFAFNLLSLFLNLCVGIPLLCFVIADYKQSKKINLPRVS